MITIAELFPLWRTSHKWLETFRPISFFEEMRLEKEYTIIHNVREYSNIVKIIFTVDGLNHRTDGPAVIGKYKESVVVMEAWYENGVPHRKDKPQYIGYHTNGVVTRTEYREKNGMGGYGTIGPNGSSCTIGCPWCTRPINTDIYWKL